MSAPFIAAPQPSTVKPQKAAAKSEHPVDVRLRRINDKILPTAPYMISVDHSMTSQYFKNTYLHNTSNWLKYTHFGRHEEKLQYLTFKDRSADSSINGMHIRGGWEDGKGGIAPPEDPSSRTSSGSSSTPRPGQAPMKKISLADYKNKDRSKATPVPPKSEAIATLGKEDVAALNKHTGQVANIKEPSKLEIAEVHGQKRTANTMSGLRDPYAFEHHPTTPPNKKPRVTPEPTASTDPQNFRRAASQPSTAEVKVTTAATSEVQRVASHEPRIKNNTTQAISGPAKASQTTPKLPKTENPKMLSLPPMLSPLASDIEEELAKLPPPSRGRSHSAASTKAASVSPMVKPSKTASAATPSSGEKARPKNVVAKPTSTPTKGPQEQKQKQITSAPRKGVEDVGVNKLAVAKAAPKVLMNGNEDEDTAKPMAPEPSKKLRLRITLKIKKRNRRRLQQYLKMKPTPGKYPPGVGPKTSQDPKQHIRTPAHQAEEKASTKLLNSEAHVSGEKRGRFQDSEDEPEQPTKRQKAPSGMVQKTHPPKQSSTSSPALSHFASAQKQHLTAPELEPRSTPMLRGPSGEGSVHTPHQSTLNGTPNAPDTSNSRKFVNAIAGPKPRSEALLNEATRYMNLGRTLKYESDEFFRKSDELSEAERMQGVIIGIESLLSFILGFVLNDAYRHAGHRDAWGSMIGLLAKVTEEARGFPHLTGLANQLEGIIRDVLVYIDLQRLDQNPLTEQFINKKLRDPAKSEEQNRAAEYHRLFRELHRQSEKARNVWHAGLTHLNVDEIASKFPNTWAKREEHRAPSGKAIEAVKAGEYTRSFTIPLGHMTSGLEAVNFGISILGEFCQRQRVEWKPKLIL